MALYYEAFERLMLSEAVSAFTSHKRMVQCIPTQLPGLSCYGFHNIACHNPYCLWHIAHIHWDLACNIGLQCTRIAVLRHVCTSRIAMGMHLVLSAIDGMSHDKQQSSDASACHSS